MYDVVLLTLAEAPAEGCANAGPRVPVLACRDALVASGASVEIVTAASDSDIDEVLDREARLVVAATSDGQVRAVVRRMTRRYSPSPSERPESLPADRTLPDLPPIGILPMGEVDLVTRLGLPVEPASVAAAVLGGQVRRLDLLRNDGGSVTLDGALFGAADEQGRAVRWRARVEVDDAVLSDGQDQLLACVVGNAGGYAEFDGLPLMVDPDPADGVVEVAVALPVAQRPVLGKPRVRVEVRRARGRAASVTPHEDEMPYLDDGVAGRLTRRRSWWVEPGAWAVYAG